MGIGHSVIDKVLYQLSYMYKGSSAGWVESRYIHVHIHCIPKQADKRLTPPQVYEQVSSLADNSIQSVPAYITVACFLASEGANLESVSLEGLTPIQFCPPEYLSLLKLFAKPER